MTNYSNLTNDQLYIRYQEAKFNFRNAIEGTQEEIEADKLFTELSKEIENRENFDWLSYKLTETKQNIINKNNKKEGINNMKSIGSTIKTLALTGVILLSLSIPTFASEVNATVINSDKYYISAKCNDNDKVYTFERSEDDTEQWNKGDNIVLDLESKDVYEALNGQYNGTVIQIYPDKNLVVVKVNNDIYSFYDTENYYKVNDKILLTFQDDEIINAELV